MSEWNQRGFTLVIRQAQRLPESAIRGVLAQLPHARHRAEAVFILEAVRISPEPLARTWLEALKALVQIDASWELSWGSKKIRDVTEKLAKSAFLPAVQAAVIAEPTASPRLLAVLARDGSEGSLDALIACLSAPTGQLDRRLRDLQSLRLHAANVPLLEQFFEGVAIRQTEVMRASGALDLATSLDVDPWKLEAEITFASEDQRRSARLNIESTKTRWVSLYFPAVVQDRSGYDDGGVGAFDSRELPTVLRSAQENFGVRWNPKASVRSPLKGKQRKALVDWVFSEVRRAR